MEDNIDVQQYIARLLRDRYTLHFAADGKEGLEVARQLLPDLIVTDLMMPNTDGLELCRTLRADDATGHIPIVVVTAKSSDEDRIGGIDAGADAYLVKPFNAQELTVCIAKLLEQRIKLREKFGKAFQTLKTLPQPLPAGRGGDTSAVHNPGEDLFINHNHDQYPDLQHGLQGNPSPPPQGGAGGGAGGYVGAAGFSPFLHKSEVFARMVSQKAIELIPQGKCDVESLATELNLSTSQLRRKMTDIMGVTPKKFILETRMKMAHDLLQQQPEMTVADVATQCGFYDHSHFIRVYRDTYGVTPRAGQGSQP